jgi:hypothetical protein
MKFFSYTTVNIYIQNSKHKMTAVLPVPVRATDLIKNHLFSMCLVLVLMMTIAAQLHQDMHDTYHPPPGQILGII